MNKNKKAAFPTLEFMLLELVSNYHFCLACGLNVFNQVDSIEFLTKNFTAVEITQAWQDFVNYINN